MTLPFNEEIINDETISKESLRYPNFVGFLNPYGIPISFRDKFGYTAHGEGLSIQDRFRVYYILKIKNSKLMNCLEEYNMTNKFQHSEKERYLNQLKRLRKELYEDRHIPKEAEKQMKLDIYDFLINCYNADTFFDGVGNITYCKCEEEYMLTEYIYTGMIDKDMDFKMEYQIYKDKIHAETFKNVMIQNLGYHSVERVPRTITTSSFNIYSTFYNYLLNDFTIFQMPKMIFNFEEGKYIQQNPNEFFMSDSELRLKDEIEAIKRLVPINKRSRYYR